MACREPLISTGAGPWAGSGAPAERMTRFQLFAVENAGPRSLLVPDSAVQFSDLYRGLPLGVYSAFRTFEHNRFLHLSRHLARTERSMLLLGWNYVLDRARLQRSLHDIVTAAEWPEMRVRFDVLAGPAEALGAAGRELIAIQSFTPPARELYETGVRVEYAEGLVREMPLAKTAEFAAERPPSAGIAQLRSTGAVVPDRPAPYEYLLLDRERRILEGTGTNFWAVRDGVVYTAGDGVLEGITREILLELIPQLGIPVRMEAIGEGEIEMLDEAALSGSSRAFMPVVSIAGQPVGDGRPGPIIGRILAAYNAYVAANIHTVL